MIKKIPAEAWKPMRFPGDKHLSKQYAVSSKGRIASYTENLFKDGNILTGSVTTGYRTLNLHRPGNQSTIYIHREVAKSFLTRKSSRHKYVIHLNHNRADNDMKNLKWVTVQEMIAHQQQSPAKIAYKEIQATRTIGRKLTATQVKTIKKTLETKTRSLTIKQIATQYGVSDMTIYRIKSGENWARV